LNVSPRLEETYIVVGYLSQLKELVEPSLEDVELERFAKLGDDQYFDEVVQLLPFIIDPISKLQPDCGETMDLVFSTVYSSAFEPPNFIAESKMVCPHSYATKVAEIDLGKE
jgi:hypothetical protein